MFSRSEVPSHRLFGSQSYESTIMGKLEVLCVRVLHHFVVSIQFTSAVRSTMAGNWKFQSNFQEFSKIKRQTSKLKVLIWKILSLYFFSKDLQIRKSDFYCGSKIWKLSKTILQKIKGFWVIFVRYIFPLFLHCGTLHPSRKHGSLYPLCQEKP